MAANSAIADGFEELALLLELTGANAFRVSAHRRVARVLRDLDEDVSALAGDEERLTSIKGIGGGSADKIIEFLATGCFAERDELMETIPAGMLELVAIPGLGPKTVRRLREELDVTDLGSLRAALDSGAVEQMPRMGAKTVANLRKALDFAQQSAGRHRLGTVLPMGEALAAHLASAGFDPAHCAGEARRGVEAPDRLDLVVVAEDPAALVVSLETHEAVRSVDASAEGPLSATLDGGLAVRVHVVVGDALGAALVVRTGDEAHLEALREQATAKGLRLEDSGLLDEYGTPIATTDEAAVYESLDLPWIPPELREAGAPTVPGDLIALEDVVSELHSHTTASDGACSIEELAGEAMARGRRVLAITDHSAASAQAGGLSAARLRRHVEAIRAADERIEGITLLAGTEVDILADGSLDYSDEVLATLDIVVASPHVALRQDPAAATARLVKAASHPLVHILGHPTGRIIHRRPGLAPDMDAVIAAAITHDTALEINAHPLRLDLRDVHVRAAVEAGALIAINTDVHHPEQFDLLRFGVMTARRGGLHRAQCLNAWPEDSLRSWLARSG